ncbi:MAG: hypothetical protein ACLFM1_07780 [Bacteroidales bacterium]
MIIITTTAILLAFTDLGVINKITASLNKTTRIPHLLKENILKHFS